jgi:YidC/Oxa1 family membrane protein insertase
MDTKNTIIGVLLLMVAFALMVTTSRVTAPPPEARELAPRTAPAPTADNVAPGAGAGRASSPDDATFAPLDEVDRDARIVTLANDHVAVSFTDFGGAVREVAFKQYTRTRDSSDPYVFNATRVAPILGVINIPGLGPDTRYELVSATRDEVVYRALLEDRLEVIRRYTIAQPGDPDRDPYRIRHDMTVRNLGTSALPPSLADLNLGTTSLTSRNDWGQFLNVSAYNGKKSERTDRSELEGGGFLAMIGLRDGRPRPVVEKPVDLVWASISSQFFASIYTGDQRGVATVTRRVDLPPFPGTTRANTGLTGAVRYAMPAIEAGASAQLGGELYVGPKEYSRLRGFERDEAKVMQFDRFFFSRIFLSGILAPLMNLLMVWTFSWAGNWGMAIVLMTLLLKIITLPFTLAASRSAKRMAKLQPQMKEIREQFKDNPQKLNQATIQLFKDNKVNPMGGCIPILITIPLFIAFFAMLQGTAELRFQGFLWTVDLSAPDTVARLMGFPINIMPVLMGATMIWQMRLTPTPSTDNMQVTIMRMMPIVFTIFCYNFAAGLALYSTVNGLFTIVQQVLVNKFTKDEPVVAPPAPAAKPAGKGRKSRGAGPHRKR